MKDKEITAEIEKGGDIITVTVIPTYIYDHMVKKYVICYIKHGVMFCQTLTWFRKFITLI